MFDYGPKWPTYAKQWDSMQINPSREEEFKRVANFLVSPSHKAIYQRIEKATGVPWVMVACNHWRESSGDFNTYLGNGQRLDRITTIMPKGRGPFKGPNAFVDGAIDAYKIEGTLMKVKDWRVEKMLYWMERINGPGYHNRGLPSPYIWGGTNIQKPGKFGGYINGVFVDNHFFPDKVDTQPGCAPILRMMSRLDPSIQFFRETPTVVTKGTMAEPTSVGKDDPTSTPPTEPPEPSIWGSIQALFKKMSG